MILNRMVSEAMLKKDVIRCDILNLGRRGTNDVSNLEKK